MQYIITGNTYNTHLYFLLFPVFCCILISPFNISYSSLLLSISSFYLHKTLKIGGWWLKLPESSVCSSVLHFSVICVRKPSRRDSISCHPSHSLFFLFGFSPAAVQTFHSEALRTNYCLLSLFIISIWVMNRTQVSSFLAVAIVQVLSFWGKDLRSVGPFMSRKWLLCERTSKAKLKFYGVTKK